MFQIYDTFSIPKPVLPVLFVIYIAFKNSNKCTEYKFNDNRGFMSSEHCNKYCLLSIF